MKGVRFAEPEPLDTPYMRARQEWDSRMGTAVVQARNWRLATFASLATLLLALVGLIYVGLQPKSVPFIIEVDKLGAATVRGELGAQAAAFKPSDVQLRYQLRRFVQAVRTVSSDPHVTKELWSDAFAMCTERCARMLTTYVNSGAGNPVKRAEDELVQIEVRSEVEVGAGTWQLDWDEKSYDLSGNLRVETLWRGMFHVELRTSNHVDELRRNPIGIYVDEFHWDKVGG